MCQNYVVRKVSTRLYFLRQLTCLRSILAVEYGKPVFYLALPSYLSDDLERLTRYEDYYIELSYAKALELSGL